MSYLQTLYLDQSQRHFPMLEDGTMEILDPYLECFARAVPLSQAPHMPFLSALIKLDSKI